MRRWGPSFAGWGPSRSVARLPAISHARLLISHPCWSTCLSLCRSSGLYLIPPPPLESPASASLNSASPTRAGWITPSTFTGSLANLPEQHLTGLDQYFAMARGAEGCTALDMNKFFDTNYHYLVGGSGPRAGSLH